MIKNENRGGFIDRQRKGVGVGEEVARSPMFSKRTTRKIKQRLCTGNRLKYIKHFKKSAIKQPKTHFKRNVE